jgi:lysozyme
MIERHEGFSALPYRCTAGFLTVGFGHNLEQLMNREEARALMDVRLRATVRELLLVLPELYSYGDVRAEAFIDMAFNIGLPSFRTFKRMIAAIIAKNWQVVANEMEQSKWYRQVGNRGHELVQMVRDGKRVPQL